MAILTWPSNLLPKTVNFKLQSNTRVFRSPISGHVQSVEAPGARWCLRIQFSDLSVADTRELAAFLVELRGSSGRFYCGDLSHNTPRGTAPGTPLVNGADQVGASLITDGWTASQTGILLKGDYISINYKLKMILTDADSDASGNATLNIGPPIYSSESPADDLAIVTDSPSSIFMLKDDSQASWDISKPVLGSFSIDAEEAIS